MVFIIFLNTEFDFLKYYYFSLFDNNLHKIIWKIPSFNRSEENFKNKPNNVDFLTEITSLRVSLFLSYRCVYTYSEFTQELYYSHVTLYHIKFEVWSLGTDKISIRVLIKTNC